MICLKRIFWCQNTKLIHLLLLLDEAPFEVHYQILFSQTDRFVRQKPDTKQIKVQILCD